MSVSKDDPHFPGRAPIDGYGQGGFRFAGMSHRGSLLIVPSGIYAWDVFSPQEITADLMEAFSLSEVSGVLVAKVEVDSPAHKAGLSVGDVIVEFNGEKVPNVSKFRIAVATARIGIRVPVKVIRDNETRILHIQLDSFPEDKVASAEEAVATDTGAGISVEARDSAYAQRNNIKADKGVIVSAIESNSPASKAGIQVGFVILQVGNTIVNSPDEYRTAMDAALAQMKKDGRNTAILYVQDRNKNEQFVVLRFS